MQAGGRGNAMCTRAKPTSSSGRRGRPAMSASLGFGADGLLPPAAGADAGAGAGGGGCCAAGPGGAGAEDGGGPFPG